MLAARRRRRAGRSPRYSWSSPATAPASRRRPPPTAEPPRDRAGRRHAQRRALTMLVVAPGGVRAARRRHGHRRRGCCSAARCRPQGAVWFQVTKVGTARNTGGPQQPFFALVLGTGARSDDPSQSPDDPGLADAIHVIGVNPALKVGDADRHPARHRGSRRQQAQLVHREQPRRQRPPRRGRRGVVGRGRADHLGDPRQLPELPADGRRDRRHRREHPHRDERRLLRRALRRRACAPQR